MGDRMNEFSKALDTVMSHVGELPAMPEVVQEVISLTEDPNATMDAVSEAIKRDPVLAGKILAIANSSYYGMRQHVGSLKLALVILGVREVKNIVLGVSMFQNLDAAETEKAMGIPFRTHSVTVGAIAKRLAQHFQLVSHGEEFIAGLLHDIGKLVLWRQLGSEYETLIRSVTETQRPLRDVEMEALGFTHADASAAWAAKWHFPEHLVDALRYHHNGGDRELGCAKEPKLAALVRIADRASHDRFDNGVDTCRSCTDDEAWGFVQNGSGMIAHDDRRRLLHGFWNDITAQPAPQF